MRFQLGKENEEIREHMLEDQEESMESTFSWNTRKIKHKEAS